MAIKDRLSRDKSTWNSSSQGRSLVKSEQLKSSWDRSSQAWTVKAKSGLVKSGQDRSSQFGSSQFMSGQLKSSCNWLSHTWQVGNYFDPKFFLTQNFGGPKILLNL